MSTHPDWALKHKKPGTELRNIKGRFYLYSVSSVFDKKLGRPKKITGPLLGSITQEKGFIPSAKRKLEERTARSVPGSAISVREFGFTAFLAQFNSAIQQVLDTFFPEYSKQIIYMAYCRLLHDSPIKNFPFFISRSMLSIEDTTTYSDKLFSKTLRAIGAMRPKVSDFMKSFIIPNDYLLFDMTNIFSGSQEIRLAKQGYNNDFIFDKQFNLLYIYSSSLQQPVFYRLFPGNVREVRSFKLCLQESGIANAVIIADKGFYSQDNVALLENEHLQFILPVKRDNKLIDYNLLQGNDLSYFKYESRYVWHNQLQINQKQYLYLFRDESLRLQETNDYLDRIDSSPETHSHEGFKQRVDRFGSLALLSNLDNTKPEQIYSTYKSRNNVEVMFDGIKNVLHADKTYMQNEDALQGWMFVNHIALQWYYIIYQLLKKSELIKRYSVRDFLIHLNEIKKVKINQEWIPETTVKSTAKLLEKLGIHIT